MIQLFICLPAIVFAHVVDFHPVNPKEEKMIEDEKKRLEFEENVRIIEDENSTIEEVMDAQLDIIDWMG